MTLPPATLESHFRQHEARLNGFCFRMVGDREAARDLTQEVFLLACEQSQTDAAWLYVCARSRCIDHLRRRGVWRRIADSLAASAPWTAAFEDQVADRELGWSLLRRLPEKSRSLLLLRAYGGLSYEEMAEVLQTTPSSVAVMLHRARKRALQLMSQDAPPGSKGPPKVGGKDSP